jgi:hypothetical protein
LPERMVKNTPCTEYECTGGFRIYKTDAPKFDCSRCEVLSNHLVSTQVNLSANLRDFQVSIADRKLES